MCAVPYKLEGSSTVWAPYQPFSAHCHTLSVSLMSLFWLCLLASQPVNACLQDTCSIRASTVICCATLRAGLLQVRATTRSDYGPRSTTAAAVIVSAAQWAWCALCARCAATPALLRP
jgi:hypothetical protein